LTEAWQLTTRPRSHRAATAVLTKDINNCFNHPVSKRVCRKNHQNAQWRATKHLWLLRGSKVCPRENYKLVHELSSPDKSILGGDCRCDRPLPPLPRHHDPGRVLFSERTSRQGGRTRRRTTLHELVIPRGPETPPTLSDGRQSPITERHLSQETYKGLILDLTSCGLDPRLVRSSRECRQSLFDDTTCRGTHPSTKGEKKDRRRLTAVTRAMSIPGRRLPTVPTPLLSC
jgi:hypothetical protein